MQRPQAFYFSASKLALLVLFFSCGMIAMTVISIKLFDHLPFISTLGILSVLIAAYPLAVSVFRLFHPSRPAIVLDSTRLSFATNFCTEDVLLSSIKSIELLQPNSDGIGKTLHIRLNPEVIDGQRRWRSKSIPLALITVNNAELLETIARLVLQSRTTAPSIQEPCKSAPPPSTTPTRSVR